MSDARILIPQQGKFEVKVPYKPKFLVELKFQIPPDKRSWNPEKKRWEFDRSQLKEVRRLLPMFFDTVNETMT